MLVATSLTFACSDGDSDNSAAVTLQPADPNLLMVIALDLEDVRDGFREIDRRYITPESIPEPGAPKGWAFGFQSDFEALDRRSSPIDEISAVLELYTGASALERNVELSIYADSDNFDGFDVTLGDKAVGYGHANGVEGLSDRLYVVRFRQGSIIATIHVAGENDLLPSTAEETAVDLARRVSEKIDAARGSSPTTSPR
jgi:hypothetical protein